MKLRMIATLATNQISPKKTYLLGRFFLILNFVPHMVAISKKKKSKSKFKTHQLLISLVKKK
jgi:hypothetical protein